jgi:hypothetical protein
MTTPSARAQGDIDAQDHHLCRFTGSCRRQDDGHSPARRPLGAGPIALSIAQLAAVSSFGRTFLYSEIKAGRLRVRKHGRRTIVMVDDAVRWLRGETDGACPVTE